MILVWGPPRDGPLREVRAALERLGVESLLVDQCQVLDTSVELAVDGEVSGWVEVAGERTDLTAVTAAYVRTYDSAAVPAVRREGERSDAWWHAMHVDELLLAWADLTPVRVVNRPAAMSSNDSKPYQGMTVEAHGFRTPETLVTTDPDAVLDFRDRHGEIIYKSVSSVRSVVARLTDEHLERLGDVTSCPTQFQRFVPGHDVRVHVVGDQTFACEIVSDADDYRYAGSQGASIEKQPCPLPDDCAERCVALAASLGLPTAGLDLRRTPDGAWYCFEVNPSPGFTFYEADDDTRIADAFARLLAGTA